MKKGNISVFGAAALGVGSMVGAGIFALLGQAGAIAGTATYLSFFLGGVVALSSGYSYSKLGATFPSSGGVIEYLQQGLGRNAYSGTFSVLFLLASVISMAMVSKTFGSYAGNLIIDPCPQWLQNTLTSAVLVVFVGLNFIGSKAVSNAETYIVIAKLSILFLFMIASMQFIEWQNFAPSSYPASNSILGSLAITYFAYTGFAVITNTAADMSKPKEQLPKAIFLAIGFTILLYVGLSFVVFGSLSVADIIKYKETALAQAAMPVFGVLGFTIISVAALLSTSSSLNANLFSTLKMSEKEAQEGELSKLFIKLLWKQGTVGLLIIGFMVLIMANYMNLESIAALGSIVTLIVTFVVHVGHYRIKKKTGVSTSLLLSAIILNAGTILLFLNYLIDQKSYFILLALGSILIGCFLFERFYLNKQRKIQDQSS
ncbi:APC family permease [Lutimonas sp.]|uniref:APC family permease n=1 Tax=Lutimonas sp. TaxID=1872403 RepID=UPI003D9BDC86